MQYLHHHQLLSPSWETGPQMQSLSPHFPVFLTNPSVPPAFEPMLHPFLLYYSSPGPFGPAFLDIHPDRATLSSRSKTMLSV